MSQPNIYVGTAYCGENEFDLCLEKINAQKGVKISHSIVHNMPILEAFEHMYSSWTNVKDRYDLFVQIDADIILKTDYTILNIYNTIKDTKYNVISYPVFDHFTNTNIWALNSYKNSIVFPKLKNKYRPDMEFTNAVRYPTTLDMPPVADHAPYPHPKHAFHFGWHRELRADASPGQRKILNNLMNAPINSVRRHALAGMHFARTYKAATGDSTPIEYGNSIFEKEYDNYSQSLR